MSSRYERLRDALLEALILETRRIESDRIKGLIRQEILLINSEMKRGARSEEEVFDMEAAFNRCLELIDDNG